MAQLAISIRIFRNLQMRESDIMCTVEHTTLYNTANPNLGSRLTFCFSKSFSSLFLQSARFPETNHE